MFRTDGTQVATFQPERRRQIGELTEEGEVPIGCPMLTRTRMGIPFRGGQRVPRCSVGWAVHDEDEVLLCMNTPTRNECWKESPERLEALIEKLRPQIEAELTANTPAATDDN